MNLKEKKNSHLKSYIPNLLTLSIFHSYTDFELDKWFLILTTHYNHLRKLLNSNEWTPLQNGIDLNIFLMPQWL